MLRIQFLPMVFVLGVACGGGKGGTSSTEGGSSSLGSSDATSPSSVTGGGGELMRCQTECDSDRDCRYMGGDIGFRCVEGECVYPACSSDEMCVAELSGWSSACMGQGDCAVAQECVKIGEGAGRCASTPDAFPCADFGLEAILRPTIEGGSAMVCGNPEASCSGGECVDPCKSDAECAPVMGHPTCAIGQGECVCTSDLDCLSSQLPGFVSCIAGRCGCNKDIDCEGGMNVDTCYAGVCGCSSGASCTGKVFDGGMLVCK